MSTLGSDPDQVDALARRCEEIAGRLTSMRRELGREVGRVQWRGRDAERFAREWSAILDPHVARIGGRLAELSGELRAQADRQRLASSAGPGDGLRPVGLESGGPASRVDLYRVELQGGEHLIGAASIALRVERRGSPGDGGGAEGDLLVTESATVSAGAGASPGAGFAVGSGGPARAVGGLGSAGISALVGVGSSWNIDESDLDGFIVALVRDRLLGPDAGAVAAAGLSVPGVVAVAEVLGFGAGVGAMAFALPRPVARSVEVGMNGGLAGVVGDSSFGGAISAAAELGNVVGVERHSESGDITVYLGSEAAGEVALGGVGWPPPREGEIDLGGRLGIRLAPGGSLRALVVDQWATIDDHMTRTAMTIDLTSPATRAALSAQIERFVRSLAGDDHGSVRATAAALALSASPVTTFDRAEYDVSTSRTYSVEIPIGRVAVTRQSLALVSP